MCVTLMNVCDLGKGYYMQEGITEINEMVLYLTYGSTKNKTYSHISVECVRGERYIHRVYLQKHSVHHAISETVPSTGTTT